MDYDLGTPVHTRDGRHVGTIDHIILSEEGGTVQGLVMRKGFFLDRDVLVPLDRIGGIDHDGVHLALDERQLNSLPDFIEAEYAVPPQSVMPTYTMGGVMFPLGVEPGVAPMIIEERKRLPPGSADIARGYTVCAVDGEELGVVRDVAVDAERGQLDYLVIDGTADDLGAVRVSAALIDGIAGEVITLSITMADLRTIADSEGPDEA